jgi:hypothetical protein
MFSFFPCVPDSTGSRGFERPVICIPSIITGSCTQGKRLNPQPSLEAVAGLWRKVVEEVESQGCWLGVHAEAPQARSVRHRRSI